MSTNHIEKEDDCDDYNSTAHLEPIVKVEIIEDPPCDVEEALPAPPKSIVKVKTEISPIETEVTPTVIRDPPVTQEPELKK